MLEEGLRKVASKPSPPPPSALGICFDKLIPCTVHGIFTEGREKKEDPPTQFKGYAITARGVPVTTMSFQLFTMESILIGQLKTENRW